MNSIAGHEEKTSVKPGIPEPPAERPFFPKGAIAFFIAMLVGFAVIWGGVYALAIHRQFPH